MRYFTENRAGFTLIEILITLAITGIMMSAVYAIYVANVKAVHVEEDRVELQQGQRVAIDFITRELRGAGCDKTELSGAGIVDARSNFIYFTADRNSDGDLDDPDEHIAFCLYDSGTDGKVLGYSTGSSAAVGAVTPAFATPGPQAPLGLAHGHAAAAGFNSHQPFSLIEELEFFYTLADGTTTLNPLSTQLADIRSVQVTILARADSPDKNYSSNQTFNTPGGQQWPAGGGGYNDNFRRRMITANVRMRNMGLN